MQQDNSTKTKYLYTSDQCCDHAIKLQSSAWINLCTYPLPNFTNLKWPSGPMYFICMINISVFYHSISALWLTNSSTFISVSFCIPYSFHIFLMLDMCWECVGTERWVMIIMISYMASHSAFYLLADLQCLVIRPLVYLDLQFPLALHQFCPQCLKVDGSKMSSWSWTSKALVFVTAIW